MLMQASMQDRDKHMLDHGEVYFMPDFLGDRGHLTLLKATRVDELEGSKVVIDVQRKTMHCHIATALDTNSTNFALQSRVPNIEPNTCCSVLETSLNAVELQKLNDRLL